MPRKGFPVAKNNKQSKANAQQIEQGDNNTKA